MTNPAPLGAILTKDYLDDCIAACLSTTHCKSFAYNEWEWTDNCQLYKHVLHKQDFTWGLGTTKYYNIGCFIEYCPLDPPPTCGNEGIQYAIYPNNQGNNTDDSYSQFDPNVYKTLTADYQDVSSSIGGFDVSDDEQQISIYGSSYTFSSQNFALNHRFYFYPILNGSHYFWTANPDDIIEYWQDSDTYSGWTRGNANITLTRVTDGGSISSGIATDLTAGQYYAFRVLYANAQDSAFLDFQILDPQDNTLLDGDGSAAGQFLQYSCDGTSAPPFPDFGSET